VCLLQHGRQGSDAQDYANEDLNGRGVTLYMAFDQDYIFRVIGQPRFRVIDQTQNAAHLNRQKIYVRKLSQAFASVCKGNAFLMVAKHNGIGGGVGAYQNPWDGSQKKARQPSRQCIGER